MTASGTFNGNMNLLNKAQIGQYATQVVTMDPKEVFFEYKKVIGKKTKLRNNKKSKAVDTVNLQFQKFGYLSLIENSKINESHKNLVFEKKQNSAERDQSFMKIFNDIQDIWNQVPEEELKCIPEDASEKLNSYLYGKQE